MPDARFVIAGEGELRPALEHQIKDHHLEKHVLLAGFRPDVLSLHKAFDIFVMSSVTEGLGTSLLDAMACGKPVVATTAGGIPEVVVDGETGFLVPPRDHEAMAAAIVSAAEGRGAAAADGRGRPGAGSSATFSAERMVQDTLRVYQRVALHRTTQEVGTQAAIVRLGLIDGSPAIAPRRARTCSPMSARAVVERDRRAVLGKRHAAGDS